ncbi:acyltransferase family protein [Cytophaga aurantiaca]|uniref:acyltransferase family protein n=1 Tax=Cytophaga aurantiaca TaxID=29530 RepID=UPI00037532B9|nr:acyltransferase [Cytophaga aurantiaca]
MIEERKYFNTFDALRFLAFFKVFIFHIPIWGFPVFDFLKNGGGTAVSFFFSLSGFLITYLILKEKESTGTFNLKAFYFRRILRIWPLYYSMLLFAFLTPYILSIVSIDASGAGYDPDWFMSIAFLENYKMIFTNDFPNVSPLGVVWSLCVEEHFYIIWGLLLYVVSVRNVHWLIIASIFIANVSRYVFYLNGWSFLDVFTNIDYFAYGAISAILFIKKKAIVDTVLEGISSSSKVFILLACIGIFITLPNLDFQYNALIEPTISGIIFLIVLTLVVFDGKLFSISKTNILSRLGIYTYSLYLTHTIIINLFVKIFEKMNISLINPFQALGFVTVCLLGTIAASMVTYYLIEKPFLKLKTRITL